jgi:hypothetical protein
VKLKTRVLATFAALATVGGMVAVAVPASADVTNGPNLVGSCTSSVSLGKLNPALGDQTGPTVAALALATNISTKTKEAGTCQADGGPAGAAFVATASGNSVLHPKAQAAKLSGNASCATGATAQAADASAATAYPLNGKVTYTMTETNALTKPIVLQGYITLLGFNSTPAHNTGLGGDVVDVGGVVIKGVGVGATLAGTIWEDPVAKLAKDSPDQPGIYTTGYGLDVASAAGCADGTPNNATITLVLSGGGGTSTASALGDQAGGLELSFGEAAPLP